MSLWQNLAFFDKEGKNYNMKYDSTTDMWSGDIFLPQVSIDLFEVGQLFILQKMFNKTTQALEYGYPHTTTNNCDWDAEWETETPDKIFLFQFDRNFNDGTQSALTQEPDGPPLVKYTRLTIPIDYDANQNFVLTATGNITLANPSIETVGQTGFIDIIQDGTGSRTLTLGTDYESPASGGITLTTTAAATDIVPYVVVAANRVALGTPQLAFG